MKKIRNIIIIAIIIVILLGLCVLKIYIDNETNKIETTVSDVKINKNNSTDYLSVELSSSFELKSHYSKIINNNGEDLIYRLDKLEDNKLYLIDESDGKTIKLCDFEVKSYHISDLLNENELYAYFVDANGVAYQVVLSEPDINKVIVKKISRDYVIEDFVTFGNEGAGLLNTNTYVITSDKKIYDLMTNTLYKEGMISIFNEYVIYDDYSIGNNYGNILTDEEGNNYKLNYIIKLSDSAMFNGEPDVVLVTDNYDLIYSIDNKLYKSVSKVYDISTEIVDEKEIITSMEFENGKHVKINGIIYYISNGSENE